MVCSISPEYFPVVTLCSNYDFKLLKTRGQEVSAKEPLLYTSTIWYILIFCFMNWGLHRFFSHEFYLTYISVQRSFSHDELTNQLISFLLGKTEKLEYRGNPLFGSTICTKYNILIQEMENYATKNNPFKSQSRDLNPYRLDSYLCKWAQKERENYVKLSSSCRLYYGHCKFGRMIELHVSSSSIGTILLSPWWPETAS